MWFVFSYKVEPRLQEIIIKKQIGDQKNVNFLNNLSHLAIEEAPLWIFIFPRAMHSNTGSWRQCEDILVST